MLSFCLRICLSQMGGQANEQAANPRELYDARFSTVSSTISMRISTRTSGFDQLAEDCLSVGLIIGTASTSAMRGETITANGCGLLPSGAAAKPLTRLGQIQTKLSRPSRGTGPATAPSMPLGRAFQGSLRKKNAGGLPVQREAIRLSRLHP